MKKLLLGLTLMATMSSSAFAGNDCRVSGYLWADYTVEDAVEGLKNTKLVTEERADIGIKSKIFDHFSTSTNIYGKETRVNNPTCDFRFYIGQENPVHISRQVPCNSEEAIELVREILITKFNCG